MRADLQRHLGASRRRARVQRRAGRRGRLLAIAVLSLLALAGATSPTAWASPRFHDVFTCHSVTYEFSGFANVPNNTFTEKIKLDGVTKPYLYQGKYTFNGPSGMNTVPIIVPPGHHELTAYAEYNTNGFKGESDYKLQGGITCAAEAAFSIEKSQEVAGSKSGFTTSEVTGKIGQTVNYQIVVKNTGNVPLTFSSFTDEKCDAGTITGGPGANPVAPGESTTYFCHHLLNTVGSYSNTATVTGTPPPEAGGPVTNTSNAVVATVLPDPSFSIEKRQEIAGSGKGFTVGELSANVGQTVDYEIVVKNTGNVPLTFGSLTDEKCDAGTITGGPGASPVAPGESTTYFCQHLFTEADNGSVYANSATDTASPPEGDGPPVTHTSNTVLVEVPVPKPRLKDTFTCNSVTYVFSGFPNRNNNTVTEKIKLDGQTHPYLYEAKFVFNGPSATNTVKITVPPGHHELTAYVEYKTNGIKGESDYKLQGGITCAVEGEFSIEKSQMIAGSGKGFTASPVSGSVGQTVDYQIVVKNTGNVPLTFSGFTDEKCDAGTITGGPGASEVGPGQSTTYLCNHVLTEADQLAGSYSNAATVTGTPPGNEGTPVTHTSNTVVVELA